MEIPCITKYMTEQSVLGKGCALASGSIHIIMEEISVEKENREEVLGVCLIIKYL